MLVSLLYVDDTPEVATPRLLLAYLQLLVLRDASNMSADACATSIVYTPAVATPRFLLAYLQLLQERDVPDMSAVACVTSVDDFPVLLSLASAAAVAFP